MAKAAAVHFSCTECGYSTGRWLGRCPSCGSFGTLAEEGSTANSSAEPRKPLLRLADVGVDEAERISTGVPGARPRARRRPRPGVARPDRRRPRESASPRSCCKRPARLARAAPALHVTGEESAAQVKMRADRLGSAERVQILARDEPDASARRSRASAPTSESSTRSRRCYSPDLGSAPGSSRRCARRRRG